MKTNKNSDEIKGLTFINDQNEQVSKQNEITIEVESEI